jgi:hypothetical protein
VAREVRTDAAASVRAETDAAETDAAETDAAETDAAETDAAASKRQSTALGTAVLGFAVLLVLAGCAGAGGSAGETSSGTSPESSAGSTGAAQETLEADNRAALDSLPPAELLPTVSQVGAFGSSWEQVAAGSALPAWIPPAAGDVAGSACLQAGAQAVATEYAEAASTSYTEGSDVGGNPATWTLYRFATDDVAQLYVDRLGAAYEACAAESTTDPTMDASMLVESSIEGAVAAETLMADGSGERTVAAKHLNLVAVVVSQASTEIADRMATLQLDLLTGAE